MRVLFDFFINIARWACRKILRDSEPGFFRLTVQKTDGLCRKAASTRNDDPDR